MVHLMALINPNLYVFVMISMGIFFYSLNGIMQSMDEKSKIKNKIKFGISLVGIIISGILIIYSFIFF